MTVRAAASVPIYAIQGTGTHSPFANQLVETRGIVTGMTPYGFYIQASRGDDDDRTSDAIFVNARNAEVSIGDEVDVAGMVEDFKLSGRDYELPTTTLNADTIQVCSSGNPLPKAVHIGRGGRVPPPQSRKDAIEFYTRLEGMRVEIHDALTVGPWNPKYRELSVVADGGQDATGLGGRGALIARPQDENPERLHVGFSRSHFPGFKPTVNVGDRIGAIEGILRYRFGDYQIMATDTFAVEKGNLKPQRTTLVGDADHLTVASFNLENVDPKVEDPALSKEVDDDVGSGKVAGLARAIANSLRAPDIIGLQEVQDNDGGEQTEVVSASETLTMLCDAIAEAGGPRYQWAEIAPQNGADGGQPGGNIRVAFLYRADRVGVIPESKRRIGEKDPAFIEGRKTLAMTFEFNGQPVHLFNNHFASKRGSMPLFGEGPPTNGNIATRNAQADVVHREIEDVLRKDPTANVVVLGDCNEMEYEEPLKRLAGEELVNLSTRIKPHERYTYIFKGNGKSIDHILVPKHLSRRAQYEVVHINSEFTEQCSDHDPVVMRLKIARKGG